MGKQSPNRSSITTKDVAQRAGVSTATAARVLGNYGSVSHQTKEKVLKAARELNYMPNALARSMVKLETQTIGLIIPDIRNSFFTTLARSAEKAAKAAGYRLFMCDTDTQLEMELEYLQDLYERRVDGILLASSIPVGEKHELLAQSPVPVVLVDRTVEGAKLDCVRTDHEAGAYRAVRHLISLGHKRIGIILGTTDESVHWERLNGYKRALQGSGLNFDPALIKKRDWEHGSNVINELLELPDRPTAIFTTNNVVTSEVLLDLKRMSVKIPDEVAIVAFDDLDTGFLLEPPLTAISQNPTLLGGTAMQILLDRISGKLDTPVPQEVIFRPSLEIRASCGSLLK